MGYHNHEASNQRIGSYPGAQSIIDEMVASGAATASEAEMVARSWTDPTAPEYRTAAHCAKVNAVVERVRAVIGDAAMRALVSQARRQ